jgi:hypothetical protein
MKANKTQPARHMKGLKWIYIPVLIAMGFTGFGQMPIFKRYYLADIPGMAWAADFYMTHTLHYLGAILLLGIIAYAILDFFLTGRKQYTLTVSAYIRIVILSGIVITGIFRVFKNLPDVVFSPGFTLFIDISHLGFMMFYMFAALMFIILGQGWLKSKAAMI